MKVVLASTAGFCIGVKRALEMVLKAINENQPKIYTYGPLIHNPQVLELLRERGITILKRGEEVPPGLIPDGPAVLSFRLFPGLPYRGSSSASKVEITTLIIVFFIIGFIDS